jgi:hypothetical protein
MALFSNDQKPSTLDEGDHNGLLQAEMTSEYVHESH